MINFPIRKVGVVAPSGIFSRPRLQQSKALLQTWGIESLDAPNLYSEHLFMAGTHSERFADLKWAISHPEIDLIWFARGGYGTVHLLDMIDWSTLSKPVLGYSDATALLIHLYQNGQTALHGPVLHALNDHDTPQSQTAARHFLKLGQFTELQGDWLWGSKVPIEGPVTGGNLCVLSTLCGTPYAMRSKGHIVLLEEIAEPAYKIHRMLSQLRLSGAFEGALGIAFGELTQCRIPHGATWTMEDVIVDALKPLDIPIYMNLPFGHGGQNILWQYGHHIQLRA